MQEFTVTGQICKLPVKTLQPYMTTAIGQYDTIKTFLTCAWSAQAVSEKAHVDL